MQSCVLFSVVGLQVESLHLYSWTSRRASSKETLIYFEILRLSNNSRPFFTKIVMFSFPRDRVATYLLQDTFSPLIPCIGLECLG